MFPKNRIKIQISDKGPIPHRFLFHLFFVNRCFKMGYNQIGFQLTDGIIVIPFVMAGPGFGRDNFHMSNHGIRLAQQINGIPFGKIEHASGPIVRNFGRHGV